MNTISKDFAEQEFNRFCDFMYLELNQESMNEDEIEDFNTNKKVIINAICNGSLIIDESGQPIYTPIRSEIKEPITFYEVEGHNLIDMDKGKQSEPMRKTFSVMQSITKKPTGFFAKMKKNPDLKVCLALTTLFLAG